LQCADPIDRASRAGARCIHRASCRRSAPPLKQFRVPIVAGRQRCRGGWQVRGARRILALDPCDLFPREQRELLSPCAVRERPVVLSQE